MAEHDVHSIGTAKFEEVSMLPRNILLRNQSVAKGDVRVTNKLASNLHLECFSAGTTGSTFPSLSTATTADSVITDGTASFIVRDVNPSHYFYRQPLTAYAVGDVVYSTKLPSYLRLECVAAGTTGTTEPDYSSMSQGGGTVVDGTCTFIVDDTRDGTPVGSVRASMYLPAGYVKCEGATVDRSNYPRLVKLATDYSLWTSDTTSNPGLFGVGDGSTTMVLPNWTGRMAQFASTAGGKVNAGLPNIQGGMNTGTDNAANDGAPVAFRSQVGAFTKGPNWTTQYAKSNTGTITAYTAQIQFNASSSNSIYGSSTTVQPPAINVFAIMRY